MIRKYRHKPIVVDAIQLTVFKDSKVDVLEFLGEAGWPAPYDSLKVVINTLEGPMFAGVGDWIIKGVMDEFYPCAPDIFKMIYEVVE